MRLDGALEPRQGAAPLHGRFIGVAKYRREKRQKCETQQQQCADEDEDAAKAEATTATITCLSNNNHNNNNKLNKTRQPLGQLQAISAKQREAPNVGPRQTSNPTVLQGPYNNDFKSVATLRTKTKSTTTTSSHWRAISQCGGNVKRVIVASLKMRAQQSLMLMAARVSSCYAVNVDAANMFPVRGVSFSMFVLCLISVVVLLPPVTLADDGDNFFAVNSFSMGPETTTPEFDYASRGQKKYGDKCDNTLECGFPGSICDPKKRSCQCTEDLPVTNHFDKCGKEAAVNESCFFNEQCESRYFQTECRDGRCICRFEMSPIWGKDGSVECKGRQDKRGPETYIDPAMIGVLVGMALMFIIICVVLRLFSQARWRENRTIFNTPNPRLMNVSLLRDSKLLHGQERRGSRMSVRAPSRQPSMASLRPHSPNPSLGKTGSGSASNASGASVRSNRSNSVAPGKVSESAHHERHGSKHRQHHGHHGGAHQLQSPQEQSLITNITTNPVAESVTVEIIEPQQK